MQAEGSCVNPASLKLRVYICFFFFSALSKTVKIQWYDMNAQKRWVLLPRLVHSRTHTHNREHAGTYTETILHDLDVPLQTFRFNNHIQYC